MNDIVFNIIIPASVGAISGGGIFLFLSKKWVSNWFEKDLKKYENKLDILKIKDEIKFDVLHKESVTRLSKLFCLISDEIKLIVELFVKFTKHVPKKDERDEILRPLAEKQLEFRTGLMESGIFLPNKIEDSLNELSSLFTEILSFLAQSVSSSNIESEKNKFLSKYKELQNTIKDQVKDIIGVDPYK